MELDFYSINNKKICDLDLTNLTQIKPSTTLMRSTLIEFLKDDIYSQYLRFNKTITEFSELKEKF